MVLKIFCFYLLLLQFQGFSQIVYPILDHNPSKFNFKQISIPGISLRIIYPEGADTLAFKTANFLSVQLPSSGIISNKLNHQWNIILQNQGLMSNGFIGLYAPRGEFYTTSSQDASLQATNDWLNLLASHETRHIHQNELARSGLSRIFRILWGSNGQGLYSNLMIPNWLWEGDAIETETRINNEIGRSNIPQFTNTLNAYLWQFGVPSYSKLMSRNFKENMPNHYVFGQFITQKLTSKLGANAVGAIWQKTLNRPQLFSFSNRIKSLNGERIDNFVESVLKTQLDSIRRAIIKSTYNIISRPIKKGYTSFDFPQCISDKKVVAIKTSFEDIPTLVEIANFKEKKLCVLGPIYPSNMLSASNKYVVWAELTYHPRWTQKQNTKLVFFNLNLNKKQFWDKNKKWICPSISPDSKYFSFLELHNNGNSVLKVCAMENKELMDSITFNSSVHIMQPRISSNGLLSYISLYNGHKTIVVYNFIIKKISSFKDFGQNNIAASFLHKDDVYFNLPVGNVDQLARWNIKNNSVDYITDTQFGAHSISFSNDELKPYVFNHYSALGNQVCQGDLNEKHPIILNDISIIDTLKFENKKYNVSNYSRWNLINPYAWGPLINSQFNKLDLGLLSKNFTNTLQLGLGYVFDINEQTGSKYFRASYQGWFPVFDFSFQQGNRKTSIYIDKVSPLDSLRSDEWVQTKWDVGVRLPFILTKGAYQEYLNISSTYSIFQVDGYNLPLRFKSEVFDGTYSSMIYQINYSKLLNRAVWDIQSRFGYQINLFWNGMPFKQKIQSELWGFQAKIFLPGIFKNHGISLRASLQQEMKGNYSFNSPFSFTRGFLYELNQRWTNFTMDYKFPIANTSLKLGRLLYFTRLKGNIFVDYGIGIADQNKSNKAKTYESLGFDFSSNFHVLRFSQGFELGVRILFKPQTNQYEFYPLVLDLGF